MPRRIHKGRLPAVEDFHFRHRESSQISRRRRLRQRKLAELHSFRYRRAA